MTTFIFLDDIRNPPDDGHLWKIARDTDSAMRLLFEAWFCRSDDIVLSLDHDLGDNIPTGYDLVKQLEEMIATQHEFKPKIEMRIHSANPVGRQNMECGIQSIYRMLENSDARN